MGAMDQVCSGCQAGVPHECSPPELHPDDKGVCIDCGEVYNRHSARLGSPRCPRCDQRRDRR